jgi:molybdopterin converting factor small subunit
MKITFKLFAGLSEFLPAGAVRNAITLEVPESCSLNDLIDQHRIPRDQVHLVLINGTSKQESERDDPILNGGDAVAMWPPVAGG